MAHMEKGVGELVGGGHKKEQSSLEGDVNGAARGSRVGELVGRGHR